MDTSRIATPSLLALTALATIAAPFAHGGTTTSRRVRNVTRDTQGTEVEHLDFRRDLTIQRREPSTVDLGRELEIVFERRPDDGAPGAGLVNE